MLCATEQSRLKTILFGHQREYLALPLNRNSSSLADLAFSPTTFNHLGTNCSLARSALYTFGFLRRAYLQHHPLASFTYVANDSLYHSKKPRNLRSEKEPNLKLFLLDQVLQQHQKNKKAYRRTVRLYLNR